jgi:hypothetical protein
MKLNFMVTKRLIIVSILVSFGMGFVIRQMAEAMAVSKGWQMVTCAVCGFLFPILYAQSEYRRIFKEIEANENK